MNDIEYARERRQQTRLERLGPNPRCLLCGEDDPCCLERHHLSGRAFGDDCVVVCRNCHRKLSDRQKDHPPTPATTPTPLECLGRLLMGIADALELLKVPEQLTNLIRQGGLSLIECGWAASSGETEQP